MLSEKLCFLEIGPVNQKLWRFKCMMLKTWNSNFLDFEDTLKGSKKGFIKLNSKIMWNVLLAQYDNRQFLQINLDISFIN